MIDDTFMTHNDNPQSFGDQGMPAPDTHINLQGGRLNLPPRDRDKLHEEAGHTTSGRLYAVNEEGETMDFADVLPRGVDAEACRKVGISSYWAHLTRRKLVEPKNHSSRDDGRLYMQCGGEIWEPCTDNLDYGIGHNMQELVSRGQFDKKEFTDFLHENFQLRGVSAVIEILMKWYHTRFGSQLVCEESVTNDMSHTDIESVDIMDIPFPSDSIEFFFADPKIPTILVFKGGVGPLMTRLGLQPIFSEETRDRESLNFWVETRCGSGFIFRANETNWDSLLSPNMEDQAILPNTIAFSAEEWVGAREAFLMCIKVLIYASIPHHTVETIGTKKKHFPLGGIPGIRGRPVCKSTRVVYLPEIRKDRESTGEHVTKHEFRGRRGHLRFYKHKRFKKSGLQNTWAFIPPVRGPNGEMPKAIFRVRKPKEAPRRGAA